MTMLHLYITNIFCDNIVQSLSISLFFLMTYLPNGCLAMWYVLWTVNPTTLIIRHPARGLG